MIRKLAAGGSGRIAFKSEYLNDYLNMEWERLRISNSELVNELNV